MDHAMALQELEALAADLAVEVRYEEMVGRGGLCRFGGRTCLIADRALPLPDRVDLFVRALSSLPLEGVYIRPHLRELLESRAAQAAPARS